MMVILFSACNRADEPPGADNRPGPGDELLLDGEDTAVATHIHIWSEADCREPAICAVCGATEGSPLGHIWISANFQEPRICSVCFETDGSPLPPGFEVHGYAINAASDSYYPHITVTYENPSLITTGQASFYDFSVFESDEDLAAVDGYEWQKLRLRVTYDDDNAWRYGAWTIYSWFDYYQFDPSAPVGKLYNELPDARIPGVDLPGLRVGGDPVNFYGIDYEYYLSAEWIRNEWVGRTLYQVVELVFLVPAGYDGLVVAFFNYSNLDSDSGGLTKADYYDEDSLFFRLKQ